MGHPYTSKIQIFLKEFRKSGTNLTFWIKINFSQALIILSSRMINCTSGNWVSVEKYEKNPDHLFFMKMKKWRKFKLLKSSTEIKTERTKIPTIWWGLTMRPIKILTLPEQGWGTLSVRNQLGYKQIPLVKKKWVSPCLSQTGEIWTSQFVSFP